MTTNWGSGFTGTITIRNSGQTPISNWQIEFDFASRITGMWNASIVSQSGSHYVVKNASWNNTIAPGATSTFGFNATPGGTVVPPTNYRFSGSSGGGGGNINHVPTAGNDSAVTNPGQAVVINLLANDTDPDGDPLTVAAIGLCKMARWYWALVALQLTRRKPASQAPTVLLTRSAMEKERLQRA